AKQLTTGLSLCGGTYRVVPLAVKVVPLDNDFLKLSLTDLFRLVLLRLVEPGVHFESGVGGRCANQADDDFESLQGHSLPGTGNMQEQTVFDLVPLAGSRRVVTQFDFQSRFVGKLLEGPAPQPRAGTVTAATIRREQQAPGLGIASLAETLPPSPNG